MKKLIVLVAAMAMIATSAYAADWNFYGSARMSTFITDTDSNVAGAKDTKNLNNSLQGNSRIGANIKVSDELTARFEYGTGVNVRILYGEWNFGAGKLLVGQTYSPLNLFYSNQVYGSDNDLLNYGGVYSGRNPMIRLTFGSFQIAALEPTTAAVSGMGTTEVTFPKIEAKYRYAADNWHVAVAGGYNTYEVIGATADYDIDSYVAAFGGGVKFGAAYVQGNVWFGQNVGSYGLYNAPADDPAIVGSNVVDNDGFGWLLVAGYKINDKFNLEIGYAYTEAEMDAAGAREDDVEAYYIQSTVNLAPGVFIVPEIGFIDNKQDALGADESESVYYGLKWQINF